MEKINEFITELHTTYDTNLLDNASLSYQKNVQTIAKSIKMIRETKFLWNLHTIIILK